MKKLIFIYLTVLFFMGGASAFASRVFVEGTDYSVDFTQNEDGKADVLHIYFTDTEPSPEEAELLIKDQLKIYGKIIDDERIAKKKEESEAKIKESKEKSKTKTARLSSSQENAQGQEEEEKFKNIIGSAWLVKNPEIPEKIKFNDSLSSYVYIGKTKKVVHFPDYIAFLKKERDDKKAKDRIKAAEEKQAEIIKTDSQE